MPFPLSRFGTFHIDHPDATEEHAASVRGEIALWANQQRAQDVERTAQGITFKGGMFRFVSKANPLVAISSGSIDVLHEETGLRVTYSLLFTQMLLIITTAVALLGVLVRQATPFSWTTTCRVLLIAWLWLFGMNYVISRIEIPKALRRVAQSALDKE